MNSNYVSYRERNSFSFKLKILFKHILIAGIIFQIIQFAFVKTYSIESETMEPTLLQGYRIISSPIPYGLYFPLFNGRLPGIQPPDRGDLVVIAPPYSQRTTSFRSFFDSVLRYLTGNRIASEDESTRWRNVYSVRRIIGIPGDTVFVSNNVVFIKPAGADTFSTEFDLIDLDYSVILDEARPSFDSVLLSMRQPQTLKEKTYFLVSDNRSLLMDSRFYGPVPFATIRSKVLTTLWPFPWNFGA